MGRLIIDADVMIDMLRGHTAACDFFAVNRKNICLSVVTLTELLAGFISAKEERAILEIASYLVKIPVEEAVAIKAGYLRHRYGKSHGTGIIDCIVAATAQALDARVVSLNEKHYPMLDNVLVPYRKH